MPRPSPPAPSVPNGGKACDSWAPGLGFHAKKCGLKDDSLTVTVKGYYKVFEVFRSDEKRITKLRSSGLASLGRFGMLHWRLQGSSLGFGCLSKLWSLFGYPK